MAETIRRLHRASYIVPVSGPVIADGAVLTEDGLVVAVGPWRDFTGGDARLTEYPGQAIIPALVNCHAHLELSWLAHTLHRSHDAYRPQTSAGFTDWIEDLLAAKAKTEVDEDEQRYAATLALAGLYAGGCRALVDIGNLAASADLGRDFKVEVLFFLELLGLSGERQRAALDQLAQTQLPATVHAPYSAGQELIRAAKERSKSAQTLFPIHLAESAEELEFLQNGGGPFRDFLLKRGVAVEDFTPPGCGPVAYLDALGVLDPQTLCVHGVELDQEAISLLAGRGSAVCLCPGSNRFLGLGRPPVEELLAQGVPLVLGTDSLASNPELSLWREMQILREDYPGLDPAQVFAFATLNGARLLGLSHRLGQIAPGVSSALPAVTCPANTTDEVLDALSSTGSSINLQWIE